MGAKPRLVRCVTALWRRFRRATCLARQYRHGRRTTAGQLHADLLSFFALEHIHWWRGHGPRRGRPMVRPARGSRLARSCARSLASDVHASHPHHRAHRRPQENPGKFVVLATAPAGRAAPADPTHGAAARVRRSSPASPSAPGRRRTDGTVRTASTEGRRTCSTCSGASAG